MSTPFLDWPDPAQELDRELQTRFGLNGISGLRGTTPATRARLSHAYTLRTHRGRTIGALQSVAVMQGRQVDVEREICPSARGLPAAIIGQGLMQHTMRISRLDLYSTIFEEAFGTDELVILTDQRVGLRLRDVWRSPAGFFNLEGRVYEYTQCFFTSLGRTVSSTDDRTVRVEAELVWGGRRRIQ